jgi:hypothetical protein
MSGREVVATAWNNGEHHRTGADYGLKVETIVSNAGGVLSRFGCLTLTNPFRSTSIRIRSGAQPAEN